jgi:hypothetical protein
MDELVGQPVDVVGRVGRLHAEQDKEARPDLSDDGSVHLDRGFGDPLEHHTHGGMTPQMATQLHAETGRARRVVKKKLRYVLLLRPIQSGYRPVE